MIPNILLPFQQACLLTRGVYQRPVDQMDLLQLMLSHNLPSATSRTVLNAPMQVQSVSFCHLVFKFRQRKKCNVIDLEMINLTLPQNTQKHFLPNLSYIYIILNAFFSPRKPLTSVHHVFVIGGL